MTLARFHILPRGLCMLFLAGCSPAELSARAAAPDTRVAGGEPFDARSDPLASPQPVREPSALVHLESSLPVSLARLSDNHKVVERCWAPCDRPLPLDVTYRVDGPDVRSSWPLRLQDAGTGHVALRVKPSLRSTYDTGMVVGFVGVVLGTVGLAAALAGGLAATSAHDANGGAPAPCPACAGAEVGGGVLMITGIAVGTGGRRDRDGESQLWDLAASRPAMSEPPRSSSAMSGLRLPNVSAIVSSNVQLGSAGPGASGHYHSLIRGRVGWRNVDSVS